MLANDAIDLAVGLARRFEGFRAQAYLDPVGIPTIGYGFTRYLDGRRVALNDPIILPVAAAELLRTLMAQTASGVLPLIGHGAVATLTPGRLAALSDFAYNLGLARLQTSTLGRYARSGRWDLCPAELRKWRLGGGKILPGLVLRREAEIALLN